MEPDPSEPSFPIACHTSIPTRHLKPPQCWFQIPDQISASVTSLTLDCGSMRLVRLILLVLLHSEIKWGPCGTLQESDRYFSTRPSPLSFILLSMTLAFKMLITCSETLMLPRRELRWRKWHIISCHCDWGENWGEEDLKSFNKTWIDYEMI